MSTFQPKTDRDYEKLIKMLDGYTENVPVTEIGYLPLDKENDDMKKNVEFGKKKIFMTVKKRRRNICFIKTNFAHVKFEVDEIVCTDHAVKKTWVRRRVQRKQDETSESGTDDNDARRSSDGIHYKSIEEKSTTYYFIYDEEKMKSTWQKRENAPKLTIINLLAKEVSIIF